MDFFCLFFDKKFDFITLSVLYVGPILYSKHTGVVNIYKYSQENVLQISSAHLQAISFKRMYVNSKFNVFDIL